MLRKLLKNTEPKTTSHATINDHRFIGTYYIDKIFHNKFVTILINQMMHGITKKKKVFGYLNQIKTCYLK